MELDQKHVAKEVSLLLLCLRYAVRPCHNAAHFYDAIECVETLTPGFLETCKSLRRRRSTLFNQRDYAALPELDELTRTLIKLARVAECLLPLNDTDHNTDLEGSLGLLQGARRTLEWYGDPNNPTQEVQL